eukprot:m.17800 g.17800  ORF g.17800 m.17800 type:complete len:393 (-) comp5547_c0_seq2:106-1284(-)
MAANGNNERAFQPSEAREVYQSLRRQLEHDLHEELMLYDPKADLSNRTRESLEKEVRQLRGEVNLSIAQILSRQHQIRDLMSHNVTGKSEEYLHINSTPPKEKSFADILRAAGNRALGGGLPGAAAMAVQVTSLMWMRTTMNYQYRYGTTTLQAMRTLYKQGGVFRFYRGYFPALAQGPLSRFGDTAANAGVLALLDSYDTTRGLPTVAKTLMASGTAAMWRICLMPIDTTKTILQVEGANGFPALAKKIKTGGLGVLYHGALASASATFVGHFPWFFTFNLLNTNLPEADSLSKKLLRNAGIGFCSSVVSDFSSNSIRVTKVAKQAATESISYPTAVRQVIAADGVSGLFFRGLQTRILANGMQGMMFTVMWKYFEEQYRLAQAAKTPATA